MSKNEFKGLRHYIDIVESVQSEQQVDEAGILNALGNLGGAVAGTVANGANAVGNAVSGAYDAAKQGVSNAANAVGNAVSGAVDPLVQGAKQGYASATGAPAQKQSASPTQGKPAAKPAAGKSDPAVLARQQQLIAAGAKIKADGIAGPATAAAEKQFGPKIAGQSAAPNNLVNPDSQQGQMLAAQTAGMDEPAQAQSASPAAPASNATANTTGGPNMGQVNAPAAGTSPYAGSPEQEAVWNKLTPQDQAWLTKGGGKPNLLDPIILSRAPNGGKPAAAPAAQATMEGTTGYNELQRIVSLVHYK